jgi:acetyl-CoA acetyltransferase
VGVAARAIKSGEAQLMIAGGVESMSRAPFVMGKADSAFSRNAEIFDTTIGWRFVNPAMRKAYGVDSMPETAENVADDYGVNRADQDAFALRSQARAAAAQASGRFDAEIVPVTIPQRKGDPVVVSKDEHPRATTIEALSALKPIVRPDGTITAGNASGVNDGAAALIVASEEAAKRHGLTPRARILGSAAAGVAPRVMGIGPVPATQKLLARLGLTDRPDRRGRAERGLRRPGPGGAARAGPARRRRAREPQRRRHRPGPPARHERRAPGPDGGRGTAAPPGPLRAGDHVHRRGPGHRDGGGAGLGTLSAPQRVTARRKL